MSNNESNLKPERKRARNCLKNRRSLVVTTENDLSDRGRPVERSIFLPNGRAGSKGVAKSSRALGKNGIRILQGRSTRCHESRFEKNYPKAIFSPREDGTELCFQTVLGDSQMRLHLEIAKFICKSVVWWDSNPQQSGPHPDALPVELQSRKL